MHIFLAVIEQITNAAIYTRPNNINVQFVQ